MKYLAVLAFLTLLVTHGSTKQSVEDEVLADINLLGLPTLIEADIIAYIKSLNVSVKDDVLIQIKNILKILLNLNEDKAMISKVGAVVSAIDDDDVRCEVEVILAKLVGLSAEVSHVDKEILSLVKILLDREYKCPEITCHPCPAPVCECDVTFVPVVYPCSPVYPVTYSTYPCCF